MEIFNSRKTEYKEKIRAIAVDERVKLRIIVPREIGCTDAVLCVTKDGEDTAYYSMFWSGMCGDDREYWEIHFSATTEGLYRYHFELNTPWGKHFVKNTGAGVGDIVYDANEFVQIVYKKEFTTPDWLKGGVIYQIFPDRFYNSGTEKTGVRSTRVMREWGSEPYWREEQMKDVWNNDYFGGDLKGIEEKLPYISALGVNCIYLNPIFEANSNHRYDTADYEKIDPLLGTQRDFESLCKKAGEYGIKIILDGVFSHTGTDSRYFNMYGNYDDVGAYQSKDSPYFDWYKFVDYPDNYRSWWGIKLLPEIIEETPSYREYICGKNGIIRKYIRCGASGWRLDVADELPDVFLDDVRRAVKDENPDALVLGEVWEDASTKTAYGERRRYLLGDQLDSVMNYPFAEAVLNFVKYGNAPAFVDGVMSIIENYPPCVINCVMNHIGTHDTERALTRLVCDSAEGRSREWQYEHNALSPDDYKRGVQLLKIASLIQYTLPGVPSLYYGDEIGMAGMKDPFNRACMNWETQDEALLRWYRRLGEIRNAYALFKDGGLEYVFTGSKAVAYKRFNGENELLVAVNLDEVTVRIPLGEEWDNAYTLLGHTPVGGSLYLEPRRYSALIIEK